MRTLSSSIRAAIGSGATGAQILSPGSAFNQTPAFAKAGIHPQMGAPAFDVQFLNEDFFDVAPFPGDNSRARHMSNGAPNIPSRISFGGSNNSANNPGQDYGMWEARENCNISFQPSTNQTYSRYINATCRSGELGNDIINVGSGGVLLPWRSRAGASNGNKHNFGYVNADLPVRSRALIMADGFLYGTDRLQPYLAGANGALGKYSRKSLAMTSGSTIAQQLGSASYNRTRREFLVSATDSATVRRLHFRLYRNVELTGTEDVQARLADAQSVEVSFTLPDTAWPTWNNESRFRHSPVLCDNGDVIVSFFATNESTSGGIGICTIRFVRTGEATWSAPTTYSVVTSNIATYGHGSDPDWTGMKTMQTRDGNVVFSFAQNYYYGAGLTGVFMDKRTGEVTPASVAVIASGVSVVHYGEDGFALYRCDPDFDSSLNTADLWVRKPTGGMVALPQKHVGKHLWEYNASYPNCYSAMLEVLK